MSTTAARVTGINRDGYAVQLRAGHHDLVADEPVQLGGSDQGPGPFGLVVAGLGACTAITLRMYAERKRWPLGAVSVALTMTHDGDGDRIERVITLDGDLDDAQRARLAEVAEKTPVTKFVKRSARIDTTLG